MGDIVNIDYAIPEGYQCLGSLILLSSGEMAFYFSGSLDIDLNPISLIGGMDAERMYSLADYVPGWSLTAKQNIYHQMLEGLIRNPQTIDQFMKNVEINLQNRTNNNFEFKCVKKSLERDDGIMIFVLRRERTQQEKRTGVPVQRINPYSPTNNAIFHLSIHTGHVHFEPPIPFANKQQFPRKVGPIHVRNEEDLARLVLLTPVIMKEPNNRFFLQVESKMFMSHTLSHKYGPIIADEINQYLFRKSIPLSLLPPKTQKQKPNPNPNPKPKPKYFSRNRRGGKKKKTKTNKPKKTKKNKSKST
jgi:hypothetical protein